MKQILTILFFFCTLGIYAQSTTVTRPQKKPQATESKAKTSGAHSSSQKKTPTSSINSQKPTSGSTNGHDWVNLGLPSGTKWATMNVGANSPSDYGSYFSWAETSPKDYYEWNNTKYYLDNGKLTKYVTDSKDGIVDGKKELDLSDDAAYVNWGSGWRMPSQTQLSELRKKCKWTWTSMGGHNGYKVVGPNGNSIFLPAAGEYEGPSFCRAGTFGGYWSRSLELYERWSPGDLYFNSDGAWTYIYNRWYGLSVRPVLVL